MDNVNIESTLNYIEKLDKKIIDEIDSIAFENNGLYKEGQKLLQVLNYSPKVIKQTREKIKNLKNIEIPQLSELENLDYSKLSKKYLNVKKSLFLTPFLPNEKFVPFASPNSVMLRPSFRSLVFAASSVFASTVPFLTLPLASIAL